MITPIDLKTIAGLITYYPREAIFYSLIGAIDVELISTHPQYARLANDPAQAYSDIRDPSNLDKNACDEKINRGGRDALFGYGCNYSKFLNLLSWLVQNGLSAETVQVPAQQQGQTLGIGRFCFAPRLAAVRGPVVETSDFRQCGKEDKPLPVGGTVVTASTETRKADDKIINTDTKSATKTVTTTKNSLVPIKTLRFLLRFQGVGTVAITFEMRSPNGFLSYLGSWYKFADKIKFERFDREKGKFVANYDSVSAEQIFGDGPYLSIVNTNGSSVSCYASVNYQGQSYCVPLGAAHTSMLMDIAIMLRNLNITPADLNAPVSVRVTD